MADQLGPVTQASLLLRLKDVKDQQAWHDFVDKYTPWIYGWCRRNGLQDADSQDVVQKILCKLMSVIPRFDYDPSEGTFRGWLATIVKNALRDHWRQQNRQPLVGVAEGDKPTIVGPPELPDPMLRLLVNDYFDAAEEKMTPTRRESKSWKLLRLHVVEELSIEELMARFQLTEAAVRVRISQARKWLKDLQEDQQAWEDFAEKIYQWCRHKGLQEADSRNVVQEILRKLMPCIDYAPSEGRFRDWLATIIKNALNDHWRQQRHCALVAWADGDEDADPLAWIVDPKELPEPMRQLWLQDISRSEGSEPQ